MTQTDQLPRCAYCRRPLPPTTGVGRPARYCRQSHRQRAYEARRRAARAALPEWQVVVARSDLDRLHDRLYALEAALDDAATDLADVRPPGMRRLDPVAAAYAQALAHVREAADDLRGLVVEPATT